jgi:hypothetical protein
LNHPSMLSTSVNFATANVTATAGGSFPDYQRTSGTYIDCKIRSHPYPGHSSQTQPLRRPTPASAVRNSSRSGRKSPGDPIAARVLCDLDDDLPFETIRVKLDTAS